MSSFVHLHVHTEYSLLNASCRIPQLVAKAKELGMTALANTDYGNMFGAIRHYNECRKAGIKAILGCQVNLTESSRHEKIKRSKADRGGMRESFHLILLAKNQTGYQNLCKLVSTSYTEGFYYKPRVDWELLEKYHEGLICLSGDLGAYIPQHLKANRYDEAFAYAKRLRDLFGPEHFFIELENHFQDEEIQMIPVLAGMAEKLGVGCVAANDVHYLEQPDAEVHDVLLCIQSNAFRDDDSRWRFPNNEYYFKTPEQMYEIFKGYEKAVENTVKIADMIEFKLMEEYQLPLFDIPENHTLETYLEHVSLEGFENRRRTVLEPMKDKGVLRKEWPEYYERIKEEIQVINDMGFPGYFLIVWDFIRKGKEMGVPVGPGRGSAAGSLVAYSLEITDIDPLQYDLLFERFLNKERVTMPDVDIDFCQDRRGEVIDYVTEKYGRENVCQIVTYGTMKARMAIKDVGRTLRFSPQETNRIAKLVPEDLGITLPKALDQSPEFHEEYEKDDRIRELIDLSIKVEGLSRNTGVHAAGVIIAPGDVTNWGPIYKDPKKGTISLQYAKDEAEQIGLLKMDFLGLKTLTVISTALANIKETTGEEVDLNTITSFDDPKTYELFCKGETDGVFQFESDGMKNLLIRLGPKRFEDFIALNALYRPGPLGSGMVDTFIEGAHGAEAHYELPVLEDILEETYGVILYQEQVMRVAQVVGGFTLGGADLLRRAMGKKKAEVMAQKKLEFLEGASKKGYPEDVCGGLFDKMAEFAKYGFNKSHSAAYALVAYQTAFLKANYPVQFMAALLTLDKDNTDKVVNYVEKLRQMGIKMLPPDIRRSRDKFSCEGNNIRFALSAIKGLGDNALESIMEVKREESIDSLVDFFEKVDLRKVNKKVIEVLVKSGAFDFMELPRRAMFDAIEDLHGWGQQIQKEAKGGQDNLFGEDVGERCYVKFGEHEWPDKEKLDFEKETLGFYLSGHPLEAYRKLFKKHATGYTRDLEKTAAGNEVIIGGLVQSVRKITTQKGDMMAFLTLEDFYGVADVVVFPKSYEKFKHLLADEALLVIKGRVDFRNDKPSVQLQEAWELTEWEAKRVRSCVFQFDASEVDAGLLSRLHQELKGSPGECQVYFEVQVDGKYKTVIKPQSLNVEPGSALSRFTQENGKIKMLLRY
ncbi:DNA polymerase III subunit alpha [Sulfidibacter corallicola]|uniref:DNA polymerase III subunit alpha n=1 Tax=Sulfidibacter corallicola TaxID=2818388 RepID=A0A8A4TH49_SULCO|nr:DNA polymerase III subunit alpha [Sulfidibacter corallicola]QTD49256.1 DNA polymerase III subunit alpha [Sulfidibacter corallicola]